MSKKKSKSQWQIKQAKRKAEHRLAKMEQRKYWQEVYKKLYDFIKSIQFKDSFYKSKSTRLYNDIIATSDHVAREICKLIHIKIMNFRKKFVVFLNTTLFVLARLRSSYTVRHQY